MCVCVCVRERGREGERERIVNHWYLLCNNLLSIKDWCMEKLRFQHCGDYCSMDAFLIRFKILYVPNNLRRFTMVAWIFADACKWCSLGGLIVKGWLVHTCYTSLQIYSIIIHWHHCLGYHLKQKMYGIYIGQMQGCGKFCNIISIHIFHFV